MIVINIIINLLLLIYFLIRNKRSSVFNRHTKLRFLILVVLGIGAFLVSQFIIEYFGGPLPVFFAGTYSYVNGEVIWNNLFFEILYKFIWFFCIVSIVEELIIILPVYFYSENFMFGKTNLKKFDFLIPFLIVSLTFSIIENGIYFYRTTNYWIYLRILTQFAGRILGAVLIGEGYYRYSVKANANRISYNLRNKNVPNIKSISGIKYNKIFMLSCIIVIVLHGLCNFLLSTFIILGVAVEVACLIYFIVYMIKLKNTNFKEDSINRFLKYNKHLTFEEVKILLEEN